MKRNPYTADEVEQCRIVAIYYPKGIRETVLRLIDTIKEMRMRFDKIKGLLDEDTIEELMREID